MRNQNSLNLLNKIYPKIEKTRLKTDNYLLDKKLLSHFKKNIAKFGAELKNID
jgi:hypothetical protein